MSRNVATVTYEPDNSLKKGYWQLFGEIYTELRSSRYLTYQLFKRNFFAMYKQSFIGVLWIIILPVINVAVFAALNNSGVFNIGEISLPYPLFAICGMAFWQIFATGLGTCAQALATAGEMVTRINFSKKSLVIAPMGKTLISFLIQMALVAVLMVFYKIVPSTTALYVPIMIVPILLLTLGLGFMLAILNAIVRDIGNILSLGITLLMYLTPVLYAKPRIGFLSHITEYNPMYHFVTAGRDLMFHGGLSDVAGFVWASVFSLALFIVSIVIFHLTETRIAERV